MKINKRKMLSFLLLNSIIISQGPVSFVYANESTVRNIEKLDAYSKAQDSSLPAPNEHIFSHIKIMTDIAVKSAKNSLQEKKKEEDRIEAERIAEEKRKEEERKAEEARLAEAAKTPAQKNYASPNGLQVLPDGSEFNLKARGAINMYGYHYTYYSSNVLHHYRTEEWYACNDGIYRTRDGYVVVASSDHPQGTIVPTPFGEGQVLDCGCASGTIDIYVNF